MKHVLLAGWIAWVLAASPTLEVGAEMRATEHERLTLLISSGLAGRLQDPEGHTVASFAATIRREAAAATSEGRNVVVLDAGRTLAPYAESRFDAGQTIARMLAAAGYQAFAPGAMDYSVSPAGLSRLARALPFPVLRPFASAATDGLVRTARIEVSSELNLRLASVLDPHFSGDLKAAGVDEPIDTDPTATLAGLGLTGELGIAVVHSAGSSRSLASHELTWKLVGAHGAFRILIDPDLGADLALRHDGENGPVILIGRRQRRDQPWGFTRADLDLRRENGEWVPVAVVSRVIEVDLRAPTEPALEADIARLLNEFRIKLSVPLGPAAPTTWEGMRDFVLDAAREAAGAEVGMLNRGAIRPVHPSHFASPPITLEAVGRMLSIDQRVVLVSLSGRQLAELATASARRVEADGSPRRDSLLFSGFTCVLDGAPGPGVKLKDLKVNGRPLQPDDPYLVATTSYLLAGGDDYSFLRSLTGTVVAGRDGRGAELRDDIVLPRLARAHEPFPDLWRRPLWRWGADRISLAFEGVQATRDPGYDRVSDSRVQARDSASGTAEARLRADRDRAGLIWENRGRLRFGLVETNGQGVRETDDLAALESSLVLTEALLAGGFPFAGLGLETELRRNRDSAGDHLPRRLDVNLATGLSWRLPHWPRLRLGIQGRKSQGFPRREQIGLVGEAQLLLPQKPGKVGVDARILGESMRSRDGTTTRVDVEARLLVGLRGNLVLTPGINLYALKDSSIPGHARYARLTLALATSRQGKSQRR